MREAKRTYLDSELYKEILPLIKDVLPVRYLRPQNYSEICEALDNGDGNTVRFLKIDYTPFRLKQKLRKLKKFRHRIQANKKLDPIIRKIYKEKVEESVLGVRLMMAYGNKSFTAISKRFFGFPKKSDINHCWKILEKNRLDRLKDSYLLPNNINKFLRQERNLFNKARRGRKAEEMFASIKSLMDKNKKVSAMGIYQFFEKELMVGKNQPLIFHKALRVLFDNMAYVAAQRSDPESIVKALREFLSRMDFENWQVDLVAGLPVKISVRANERKILINKEAEFYRQEMPALLAHEIIHLLKAYNGRLQPLKMLRKMAFYQCFEEGIAEFVARKKLPKDISTERFITPELRVVAVSLAIKHRTQEVYDILRSFGISKDLARSTTVRVKQGNKDGHGCFTKDHIYYSGLCQVRDWLAGFSEEEQLEMINRTMIGKIKISDLEMIEKFEGIEPKFVITNF